MPNPQERPTLHDILDHAFFTCGVVPKFIPVSTLNPSPKFPAHLATCLTSESRSGATDGQLDGEVLPSTSSATSSLAQQEREFQKAVQPGSPISSLLSSAHQPLMVAPAGGSAGSDAGTGTFSVSSSRLSDPSPGLSSSAISLHLLPTLVCFFAGDRATSFTACNLRSRVGSPRMLA
jgi:serine/threonine protein kinase